MRIFLFLILAVVLHLSWSVPAYAKLSGSLEWDYGQYHADEGGGQVADASYFAQKYALWLTRSGTFMGGRGGQYNLALGGEWWGLNSDNEIYGVENNVNLTNAKFLYRGDLTFSPGGLPFYFRMYGRDISVSRFRRDRFYSQGSFDHLYLSAPSDTVLTPGVINDIDDGTNFEYGASLVFGIKNGSYLGRYRNIMSHLPKVYADYRETHVKDLLSVTPQQYRTRDLAFVSLNKKHNWFHYRYNDYLDELNDANSSNETTYLLGTIDQNLRREWINLTNWIKLSTDGRYTSKERYGISYWSEDEYSLNLFITTQRLRWNSSFLSSFTRNIKPSIVERNLIVPYYVSGSPNRNNAWRFRVVGARRLLNVPFSVVSNEIEKNNVYTALRWETDRTTRRISAPALELEGKFGDYGDGGAARASYEYYSNKKLARADSIDLFTRLSAAYFIGTPSTNGSDIDLFEISGRFDLAKQLSSRLRTGFGTFLMLGSGKAEHGVTEYIRPISLQKLKGSLNTPTVVIDGTVWRIEGLWFAEHVSLSRVSNRLETGVEYQSSQSGGRGQYYLSHRLRYAKNPYSFDTATKFLYGDALSVALTSSVANVVLTGIQFDGSSLSNSSSFTFDPNRENHFKLAAGLDWRFPDVGNSGFRVRLLEEYRYTRFLQRGVRRRLVELSQLLDYERLTPDGTQTYEVLALTGIANYYPTSWSRLACKLRWQQDLRLDTGDIGFGLYSGLNFSLLSVGLEYGYGMRTADNSGAILDRDEQRWSVSVRKVF